VQCLRLGKLPGRRVEAHEIGTDGFDSDWKLIGELLPQPGQGSFNEGGVIPKFRGHLCSI